MDYVWSCDTVRLVAAPTAGLAAPGKHPMEGIIQAAASADVPVLITPDKARAKAIAGQIHRHGRLGDRDLVVLDCTLAPLHDSSRSCFRATRDASLSSC